jgi:hypothetical protein
MAYCNIKEVADIDTLLTPGLILKTLFRYTLENQRYFADYYVKCDKSLVYKWTNDTINIPKKHIDAIVRFAADQTRHSAQLQIKNDIKQILSLSRLCDDSREFLLKTEEFEAFLHGAFLHAIAIRTECRQGARVMPQTDSSPELPKERSRLRMIFICGYYMGGSGNEPVGLSSFLWGVLVNTPIIAFALVSIGKNTIHTPKAIIYLIVSYALLSGLGAFAFYNSGLRAFVEQLHLGYGFQECVIAGFYGFAVSGLPALALFLVIHGVNMPLIQRAAGLCLPSFAAALTALSTWVINRPELEINQFRGFTIAMILRLVMFLFAIRYISRRPFLGRQPLYGTSISDRMDSTALKSL